MKTTHRMATILMTAVLVGSVSLAGPGEIRQSPPGDADPLNRIFGSRCLIKAHKMAAVTNLETLELQFMKIEGDVEVLSIKMDITCEEVVIDLERQEMVAKSKEDRPLIFRRHEATGNCNRLNYDIRSDTLHLDGEPMAHARVVFE